MLGGRRDVREEETTKTRLMCKWDGHKIRKHRLHRKHRDVCLLFLPNTNVPTTQKETTNTV